VQSPANLHRTCAVAGTVVHAVASTADSDPPRHRLMTKDSKKTDQDAGRGLAALLLVFAVTIAGCASLTPQQCLQADWRQIGYSDGINGVSGARIDDHAKACAEQGIRPNLDEYLNGRSQGLINYCQPENGFALGRRGAHLNGADCAEYLKPAFIEQYRRGNQLHLIETDLGARRARIHENGWQIRRSNQRIAAIRADLSKSDLPAERRTALLNEFNRQVELKNYLGRENLLLEMEAQRLQFRLQMTLREFGR
jgi:hypothetical protein